MVSQSLGHQWLLKGYTWQILKADSKIPVDLKSFSVFKNELDLSKFDEINGKYADFGLIKSVLRLWELHFGGFVTSLSLTAWTRTHGAAT